MSVSKKSEWVKIAVDVMWGDIWPEVSVPASLKKLNELDDLMIYFKWNTDIISDILEREDIWYDIADRIRMAHTKDDDNIQMDTKVTNPKVIIKKYKNSSMMHACKSAKNWESDWVVSAWNTWAFVTASVLTLKTLVKSWSFALASSFPNIYNRMNYKNDRSFILDLWANKNTSPEKMVENVIMAKRYIKETLWIDKPEVGIITPWELTDENKKVLDELNKIEWIIVTTIDPLKTINNTANIIIVGWFEWNILLKSCEWAVKIWMEEIKKEIKNNVFSLLCKPWFKGNIDEILYNYVKEFLSYELNPNSDINIKIPNLKTKKYCCLHGIKHEEIKNNNKDWEDYEKILGRIKGIRNHFYTQNWIEPKIWILNIWEESWKWRDFETKLSDELKEIKWIDLAWFIEPNNLLDTDCDIIITDNKTWYIAINSIRWIIGNLIEKMGNEMSRFDLIWLWKLSKELKNLIKETEKWGVLLGTKKTAVKVHWNTSIGAFANGLLMAYCGIQNDVRPKTQKDLEDYRWWLLYKKEILVKN